MTPDTYPDLFFGYGVIWCFVALYLLFLRREQKKLVEQLDSLRK